MTESVIPAPDLEAVQTDTAAIVAQAEAVVVANDADLEVASRVLKDVATNKKSLEDRRDFFVRPLNDQVKNINTLFKTLAAPLLEADRVIRLKVTDYRTAQAEIARREQERINAAARAEQERLNELARKEQERLDKIAAAQQAKANKAAEKKGIEAPVIVAPVVVAETVAAPVVIAPPPVTVGNVTTRKVWKFKVVNAALVPREFLYVDERMIREAIAAGTREIAGVSIYQEEQIAVR
jgi:hypothetical protein